MSIDNHEDIVVEFGQNPLNLTLNQINSLVVELERKRDQALETLKGNSDLNEIFSLSKVSMTINGYEYSLEVLLALQNNGDNHENV